MTDDPQRLTKWEITLPIATGIALWIAIFITSPHIGIAFGLFGIGYLCLFIAPATITYFISLRVQDSRIIPPHCCQKCRYDRKGLAATANCPECGERPSH